FTERVKEDIKQCRLIILSGGIKEAILQELETMLDGFRRKVEELEAERGERYDDSLHDLYIEALVWLREQENIFDLPTYIVYCYTS
ncbi:hypothetical protein ABTN13_20385, partial [Acinetobacter baumannii]